MPAPAKPKSRRTIAGSKRKKHYITGVHQSIKCKNGPAKYRSGWEKVVLEYLDLCTEVTEYQYEPFQIKYVSNRSTGRIRIYIPDFLIKFTDGTVKLVEVKRENKVNSPTVKKKTIVAKAWAGRNGMSYELWTDKKILELRKVIKNHLKILSEQKLE
jgi:hypothetical protein